MPDECKRGKPVRLLPDETAQILTDKWAPQERKAMDVTQEFNAIMGRPSLMEDVSSNDLHQDYDFVDDVSNKPLKQ